MESEGVYMYSVSHGYRLFSAEFAPAAFRMTIAAFNIRAQRVVLGLGFTLTASFLATTTGVRYQILVRPSGPPAGRRVH